MEVKKTDKANLEKKRTTFLQLGYVIVLAIVLLAFEWGTKPSGINLLGELEGIDLGEEIIPITRQIVEPPPPPPPPQTTEIINIVDDDVEIEDELFLDDTDADEEDAIIFIDFDDDNDDEHGGPVIFYRVEEMPKFKGQSSDAFRIYIRQNLKYPIIAQENGIGGTVYVQFDINTEGLVTNVIVVRPVDPSLDKEAVRVIKSSPEWMPGKQRDVPVNVRFTFPIAFQLQ